MTVSERTIYDRFFPSRNPLMTWEEKPDTRCDKIQNLGIQAIEWLADRFPERCAKALPSCLAPTESIPWEEHPDLYEVDPEEEEELQRELDRRGWDGFGIQFLDQCVVKGYTGSMNTCRRRTEPGCGLFPLRWEGGRSCAGRAPMARRIRHAIEKWNLDRLYVPTKRIAKLKFNGSKREVVVAEKLDLMGGEAREYFLSLPKKEKEIVLRQLFTLCAKTSCSDLKFGENITFVKSGAQKGKLALIDTEPFGIDMLLQGQIRTSGWYDPSSRMYQEEEMTSRNIYLIGGERNAELAMGMDIAKQFLYQEMSFLQGEDWDLATRAYGSVSLRSNCEYSSNFIKTWALRLLLPAAAIAASALAYAYSEQRA
jgi:hypothetical protein